MLPVPFENPPTYPVIERWCLCVSPPPKPSTVVVCYSSSFSKSLRDGGDCSRAGLLVFWSSWLLSLACLLSAHFLAVWFSALNDKFKLSFPFFLSGVTPEWLRVTPIPPGPSIVVESTAFELLWLTPPYFCHLAFKDERCILCYCKDEPVGVAEPPSLVRSGLLASSPLFSPRVL